MLKPKSYLATDYQDWLVDYGRRMLSGGSLKFQQLDATAMDAIQDNSFHVVAACEFIEHLPSDGLVVFLKECKRVLKKGGIVIATTPNRSCHGVCQNIQRRFILEQGANYVYRNFLKLFPKGSKREKVLDKIMGSLYGVGDAFRRQGTRQKLSFPEEYSQTKLVYKPGDKTKAFGLCLVLQV